MTGISLDIILQTKPDTWQYADYAGKNCVTIELDRYKDAVEYNEIKTFVSTLGIDSLSLKKIERVQHPFAYNRFLLRKHQLEKRNSCTYEPIRKYFVVSESKVKEALEYNLDQRRTSSISLYQTSNSCYIITKRLRISTSRDSEEYPEYVIYCNN